MQVLYSVLAGIPPGFVPSGFHNTQPLETLHCNQSLTPTVNTRSNTVVGVCNKKNKNMVYILFHISMLSNEKNTNINVA